MKTTLMLLTLISTQLMSETICQDGVLIEKDDIFTEEQLLTEEERFEMLFGKAMESIRLVREHRNTNTRLPRPNRYIIYLDNSH